MGPLPHNVPNNANNLNVDTNNANNVNNNVNHNRFEVSISRLTVLVIAFVNLPQVQYC